MGPGAGTKVRLGWTVCRAILLVLLFWLGAGSRSYAASCFPAPSGLVGWWTGDGNANDIAGTNNGTLQGGATASAAGMVGSAFSFDGTNGYVQVPDAPALDPTNLTVEAWVRFDSLDSSVSGAPAGEQFIVFKQNSRTGSFEGYYLGKTRISGQDRFTFQVSSASGTTVELDSATVVTAGVWYHVAGVRGTNYVQLYVNGQVESTNSVSFAQDYGTLPLYFGTSGQPTYWDGKLKGALDEVSLYNRALSSSEVAAIYAAGAGGKCKGPSITVQPQSQTVAAGTNVVFTVTATGVGTLSYQWQFNGVGISGATGTTLALSSVQPANAGSYAVVVTNSLGSVTSAVAVLTVAGTPASCSSAPSGLAGWWPGDGNANDIAGTNNGTLQGGATAGAAGLVGPAFALDGTNGYVQIPDSPALKPTNLTVEAWVRFASLDSSVSGAAAGEQFIVFKQNSRATSFEGYYLGKTRIAGQDHFTFQISSASGVTVELDSVSVVAAGVWYHVAGVRGSDYVQLYVNGELETTNSISFAQDYGTLPLYFGTSGQTYWDGKLNGTLDEVEPLQSSFVLQRGRRDLCGGRWGKMQRGQHYRSAPESDGGGRNQRALHGERDGYRDVELPVAVQRGRRDRRHGHKPGAEQRAADERRQLHGGGDQHGGFGDQRGGGLDGAGAAGDYGPADEPESWWRVRTPVSA